jgi:flagellum-specific peptidoglycan hydrolase FlgJ
MQRLEFIAAIKEACQASEKIHGIPWGWLAAQAVQESGGYGVSDLSVKAFNLYGIKGGGYYQGATGYAKFGSWREAIMFQGWQLNQSRYLPYKPLVIAGKFKEYGDAISKAGWCPVSSPTYGEMIGDIAREYDLDWIPAPTGQPPVIQPSVAMQWCIDQNIIDRPATNRQVDLETLAWALFKAKGKI